MITQQHEHEIQQKAQAPSPVKQPLWKVILFTFSGIALPLVTGSMVWWPWVTPNITDVPGFFFMAALGAFFTVAVGAYLLCFAFRVWWVAVFAGIAWIVGELLGAVVRTLVEGGWPAELQATVGGGFWPEQLSFLTMASVPLLIGMAIGAGAGIGSVRKRAWRQ